MASQPWAFVCPSRRGIGHAITRRLLLNTRLPVLATTRQSDVSTTKASLLDEIRSSSPDLHRLGSSSQLSDRLHLVRCDVTDEETIQDAANLAESLFPLKTHHLHLACVIPGILHAEKSPAQVDQVSSLQSFQVNAVGPLLAAKYFTNFLPRKATKLNQAEEEVSSDSSSSSSSSNEALQLPKHATWLSMAARVGSTTDNKSGGWYSYRASKAAVFSLIHSLDLHLQTRSGDKALAMAYHPGTVKTDFTRAYWGNVSAEKLFSTQYAAEKMLEVICGLRVEQRGKCMDWRGAEIPP